MSVTATTQPIKASSLSSVYHAQWRVVSSASLAFSARASREHAFSSSYLKLGRNGSPEFSRNSLRCNSSNTNPVGPGDNESKSVLDAFFLGKALAEAINERIESTVGEVLSTVGRLQAEQQKQVQDFQEEVLERAKRAKGKAAREAMETKGLVVKSSVMDVTTVGNGATSPSPSPPSNSVSLPVSPAPPESYGQPSTSTNTNPDPSISEED